ncbi:MAG: TniB family NTP-binding protein, partial [Proteobacteria bacterium]|nr:TniB family NTP-binding protein [Pseudomonadota bacterium]
MKKFSAIENYAATYEHLLPSVREVLMLTDAERMSKISLERWILYPKAKMVLERLEELYSWPLRLRMPNMLIIGPTNNGKTTLVTHFMRSRKPWRHSGYKDERTIIPVVKIQMPPRPNLPLIYATILEALKVPHTPSAHINKLQPQALDAFRRHETRMFIVDEVHDIRNATTQAQYQILSLFKYLGNELQIPIIGVGTEAAAQAFRIDPQMANRFEPYTLPRWDNLNLTLQLLASFACMLPLKKPSRLIDPQIGKLVLNLTDGSIGDITTLM